MKIIKFLIIVSIICGSELAIKADVASDMIMNSHQALIVIEQDYAQAVTLANKENKLIFIDFYTSWCAPCKKLDQLVFQNDSIQHLLGKDIILLKYDAENDTVFHLSKKHHVSSYPTGLILNEDGYVVNRKYGFQGDNVDSIYQDVALFINESKILNDKGSIIKGYANKVDVSIYPKFYVDYVNRVNTKKDASEINEYWNAQSNIFSEEYFSTLLYFAGEASDNIINTTLHNRAKYLDLYGKTDIEILMYFFTMGKFSKAISTNNQSNYDQAVKFAKSALSQEWLDDVLSSFNKEFLKAQNKWSEVLEINTQLKQNGKFDNGYVNHFSWQVYENCQDHKVIEKCLKWMREVTLSEPIYQYLDTYAHLLYKKGDNAEAKKVALSAVAAGKREEERTVSTQQLIDKISNLD